MQSHSTKLELLAFKHVGFILSLIPLTDGIGNDFGSASPLSWVFKGAILGNFTRVFTQSFLDLLYLLCCKLLRAPLFGTSDLLMTIC
jgi:hypothetical protein